MANKLNIYACSGLENGKGFEFWRDGTNTLENTQAVNSILADINLCRSELLYLKGLSDEEKQLRLNKIVFDSVCLHFAQQYSKDTKMLRKAGNAIGSLVAQGKFGNITLDENAQKAADDYISEVNAILDDDKKTKTTKQFSEWWSANVTQLNKVRFSAEESRTFEKALRKAVAGIGSADDSWKNDPDLSNYLTKGGEYFLYLYFTEAQLRRLPEIFRLKAQEQMETYNYCYDLFVGTYGNEENLQKIIRASIVSYFGDQPETVCDDIASGKRSADGVGLATEIIVAIIAAAVNLVIGVITAVCAMAAQIKVAEHQSIDKQAISASTPNADDFDGLNFNGTSTSTNWITWALLGVGAYWILKN